MSGNDGDDNNYDYILSLGKYTSLLNEGESTIQHLSYAASYNLYSSSGLFEGKFIPHCYNTNNGRFLLLYSL